MDRKTFLEKHGKNFEAKYLKEYKRPETQYEKTKRELHEKAQ